MDNLDFWIFGIDELICPVCDSLFRPRYDDKDRYRYCPFCGNRLHIKEDTDE